MEYVTGQHDVVALEKVVEGLREVDEAGEDYDDIVEVLELLGHEASLRKNKLLVDRKA